MEDPVKELTEQEFLEELLWQLVSDGNIHPDHDPECNCIYGQLRRRIGVERAKEVVASAKVNAPRPMPESINVHSMESFPKGSNPFHHDPARMGMRLGTNVFVMYGNHPTERAKDLVIFNQSTGERILIQLWG